MIQLYGVTNLFASITNLAIAVFVLLKGRGSKLSQIWSVFAFCVAIYGLGAYFAAGAKNYEMAFFWWQFSYVGVVMLPPLFVHFVHIFLGVKRPSFIKVIYAVNLALLATDIFSKKLFIGHVSLLFQDLRWFSPAWWVYPPGPLHIFFTIFSYGGLLSYALVILLKAYKRSSYAKQTQIKYFFIAMFLGFVGGGTSFLPCFGIDWYPVLNIMVPLYTLIIGFTIVRHQLMDITVIVKKTLIFAGLFASSYAIFAFFVYLGSISFENLTQNRWIALIPSIFIIVLILRPLEVFLRNVTDKYLFQKNYDYKSLLRTFTDEVITVIDLNNLVNLTVNKLSEIIKLESASIFLDRDENGDFALVAATEEDLSVKSLAESTELVEALGEGRSYILSSELEPGGNPSEYIKNDLKAVNSDLVIPLMQPGRLIGALALGKKKSDEDFTQDDIDILLPLARTFTVAISNAMLFEKLSESQAQAAQREKMAVIGTLSAGINHEICNPLGIARGQCEMFLLNLKEGLYADKSQEELLDKAQEIMDKVIKETDRATVITRKLSSFAKPARGVPADDVNVENEIDEVITLIEHDLKLDNILISKEISEGVPGITADRKQIQEVLFNIIRNAAQALKEKGNIYIRVRNTRDRVFIDIEDTGDGISQKNLEQIFDPFFTTKEPGKGTGLGLFIVKQIVEKNRGAISARSTPGVGTVFTLEFQASKDNADTEDIQ